MTTPQTSTARAKSKLHVQKLSALHLAKPTRKQEEGKFKRGVLIRKPENHRKWGVLAESHAQKRKKRCKCKSLKLGLLSRWFLLCTCSSIKSTDLWDHASFALKSLNRKHHPTPPTLHSPYLRYYRPLHIKRI